MEVLLFVVFLDGAKPPFFAPVYGEHQLISVQQTLKVRCSGAYP
jgi:hypothetical protein